MTATETITSNPRVLGADPLVEYQPAKGEKPEVPGGIGEEDIVYLVLPTSILPARACCVWAACWNSTVLTK